MTKKVSEISMAAPKSAGWVRFSERDDVISSTDLLALVAPTLKKTPRNWKWMILAAHNGLQGALVCAIKDSAGINVLTNKSATETLAWLDNPTEVQPLQRLDHFLTLIKKYLKKYPETTMTVPQKEDLKKLHDEFRNQFTHFAPMQWAIEMVGLPRIIRASLDLTEDAMQKHQVAIHLTGNMKRRFVGNLRTVRQALANR